MFPFPRLPSYGYGFTAGSLPKGGGLPHSEIPGSTPACGSPRHIGACPVLHRLLAPRHPPYALIRLTSQPNPQAVYGTHISRRFFAP
jgi:hypothetical protein